MFNTSKKNFLKLDLLLLLAVGLLIVIGLTILYSASLSIQNFSIKSQILSTILGLFFIGLILLIDYDFIKNLYKQIYLVSLILMVLVTLFGTGQEQWGANNWLVLGPISFQPSEFVKIGLIISFSAILEKNAKKMNQPLVLLKLLFIGLLPVALIAKEDFGTAAVTGFIIAVMLFTAGLSYKYIIPVVGTGLISAPVVLPYLYNRLDEFQKSRIKNWLKPEMDIADTGFQAWQGRIAVGSGKWTGRGLFKGVQNQNNFIPEKHTDYIFTVCAEETGFIGAFLVISLYTLMIARFIQIAKNSKDLYGSCMTMGVAAMFLIHIFENIGMTIGVMPVTGIPLPFMSHGGTFQLINLIAIGLVLSVSVERHKLEFGY